MSDLNSIVRTDALECASGANRSRVLDSAVLMFGATMFVGASLLFFVQPIFAKLVVPRLGGSPAVWNTCVLFFQTVLLLGYLYAHLTVKLLGTRGHAALHGVLLLLPLAWLPFSAGPDDPGASARPVTWLLQTLTLRVGLPFFVLATTAPLLQRWFGGLPIASARDPYFLYSASNLGSILALLAYPLFVEPSIGLMRQSAWWAGGYALFIVLMSACVTFLLAFGGTRPRAVEMSDAREAVAIRARDRVWWVLLAFAPSSLMLGVTMHITTDIAAVPLLWIGPLALYLLTFVIAFARYTLLPQPFLVGVGAPLVLASLISLVVNAQHMLFALLHLVTFFVSALVCHADLAARRPGVSRLTEFYLWMSFGGMLGGVFNSLVAPQAFGSVFEYPLVLCLIMMIFPPPGREPGNFRRVALGHGLFACRTVALCALLVIATAHTGSGGSLLLRDRSFFGVVRVMESAEHTHRILLHGNTIHGWQSLPANGCEPSSYYSPAGPIGELMRATASRLSEVGVIGLGTGALACYAQPNQTWTFYEIDPLIEKVARDERYFTHLARSRARVEVRLGDGRMTLQRAPPGKYDLLVLDAFSSDAIPVHLLTTEAMQLYFSRLQHDGLLAVHISNRHLDLEPQLAAITRTQGLHGRSKYDGPLTVPEQKDGRRPSHWVVIARTAPGLTAVARGGWRPLAFDPGVRPWTDDYSNILSVLMIRRSFPVNVTGEQP